MRLTYVLVTAMGLLLFACADSGSTTEETTQSEPTDNAVERATPQAPRAMLIDGSWEANYIMNAAKSLDELYPNGKPTVIFNAESGQVGGSSGCNNYRGNVTIDGNKLEWGELASTRKMCPDMSGEELFLETLKKANQYSVSDNGNTLNLILGDLAIMRLQRTE